MAHRADKTRILKQQLKLVGVLLKAAWRSSVIGRKGLGVQLADTQQFPLALALCLQ
jgi:hypothetical protein